MFPVVPRLRHGQVISSITLVNAGKGRCLVSGLCRRLHQISACIPKQICNTQHCQLWNARKHHLQTSVIYQKRTVEPLLHGRNQHTNNDSTASFWCLTMDVMCWFFPFNMAQLLVPGVWQWMSGAGFFHLTLDQLLVSGVWQWMSGAGFLHLTMVYVQYFC